MGRNITLVFPVRDGNRVPVFCTLQRFRRLGKYRLNMPQAIKVMINNGLLLFILYTSLDFFMLIVTLFNI